MCAVSTVRSVQMHMHIFWVKWCDAMAFGFIWSVMQLKLHNIKCEWTCLNVRKCKSCSFWISNTINAVQATANMPEMHFLVSMHALASTQYFEWLGTWMNLLHKTGAYARTHQHKRAKCATLTLSISFIKCKHFQTLCSLVFVFYANHIHLHILIQNNVINILSCPLYLSFSLAFAIPFSISFSIVSSVLTHNVGLTKSSENRCCISSN